MALDGVVDVGIGGDEEADAVGPGLARLLQELHAVSPGILWSVRIMWTLVLLQSESACEASSAWKSEYSSPRMFERRLMFPLVVDDEDGISSRVRPFEEAPEPSSRDGSGREAQARRAADTFGHESRMSAGARRKEVEGRLLPSPAASARPTSSTATAALRNM